jgi:hypothetical protein
MSRGSACGLGCSEATAEGVFRCHFTAALEPSGDRDVDEVTLASSSDSLRSALLSSSSATRSFSRAISSSLLALARLCSD